MCRVDKYNFGEHRPQTKDKYGELIQKRVSHQPKKKRPGKNPARLKVTTKSKPAYEKNLDKKVDKTVKGLNRASSPSGKHLYFPVEMSPSGTRPLYARTRDLRL